MEGHGSTVRSWKTPWFFGLAVICLLSAVVIGYLARVPVQASAVKRPLATPAVAHDSDAKITRDPLKQEADKRAEPLLTQLRKSPGDPSLLAEIGKIYYQMRQFHTAAGYYADSSKIKPDAVILVKLGGAYHFDGDDDKAIGAWNQALRLDPRNADALFNIGFVQWHARGNRKGAIAAWQTLLATNPNHPKRAQVEELLAQAKRQSATPAAENE